MSFLRSRNWILARRIVLVSLILVLGYRAYGDTFLSMIRGPRPQRDIVITRSEFRPELGKDRPGWIIGFRNDSPRYTYDEIQLEATFTDDSGKVVEVGQFVVRQKLPPAFEQIVGSTDFKSRGGATRGSLRVLGAVSVK